MFIIVHYYQGNIHDCEFNLERSLSAIKRFVDELYQGHTVQEIIADIAPEDIKDLQCAESQMAMLSVVAQIISEQATIQMITLYLQQNSHESLINTIGTNILVEVLKQSSCIRREIGDLFSPKDFENDSVKKQIASILTLALQVNSPQVEEYRDGYCMH